MLTDAERIQLRADVEATLPDTCRISRGTETEPVFNEVTGEYDTPEPSVIHANVACRVSAWGGSDRVVQAGEQPVTLRVYDVTLPVSVSDLEVNDVLEVLTSEDLYLIGKKLRVRDPKGSSLGVQRRINCEDDLG